MGSPTAPLDLTFLSDPEISNSSDFEALSLIKEPS